MNLKQLLPGLLLLIGIGLTARILSIPVGINPLILSLGMGIVATNLIDIPSLFDEGVSRHKLLLETGIVIMGTRLALNRVLESGPTILALVIVFVLFTAIFVESLSRIGFDVQSRLSSLLASGASICGVSAIVAVAGSIDANEEHIAYAVSTILLFDALTLFLYPIFGVVLPISEQVYGIWVGVSMFSTGPVTAAGFALSPTAGKWATITKLTRNLFIGFAAIAYSVYYARQGLSTSDRSGGLRYVWDNFPKFVIGFVLAMVIANIGLLSESEIVWAKHAYKWLFMFAFAGLGLNIQVSDMRDTGVKPILITLTALIAVSTLSLGMLVVLF